MARIQVLDRQVAELIAAGEVVERPSSVIKELVENAIDAGASVITVEIRRGGVTYLRVTDNGCGMAPDDVPTAFLRHATSKIRSQDDLDAIGTLGFRGEALASISAVSHVELITRETGAQLGMRYVCGGAEEPYAEEIGCPEGTTIVVRDLFFNTPARMKFLKKDSTEGNSVAGVLDKMALSHPEISFRFLRDGKEQMRTPGDNQLSSAIYGVFGREFLSGLIPVEYEYEHVKVSGFISKPTASRPNRSMQNFFLNGRFIRSRTAMVAMEEAYKGSIMVGKFPSCVLRLSLAFSAVDVNVHPAKLEVRFVNERPIFDAVYHAVKSALNAGDSPKLMEFKKPPIQPYAPIPERHEQVVLPVERPQPKQPETANAPAPFYDTLADSAPKHSQSFEDFASLVLEEESPPQPEPPQASHAQPPEEAPRAMARRPFHSRIIGEAFRTYLIIEYSEDELMLIDKHAAHERLLYERLKRDIGTGESQGLLSPVPVTLEKDEYTAVLERKDELARVGFEVEDYGVGTVLVRGVPLLLDGSDAADAVMEIAGYLAANRKDFTPEHLDWVYHNVACRAAIKGGDVNRPEELVSLAQELERNPAVRYCPHGRPIYILLKRSEIERQFGREG